MDNFAKPKIKGKADELGENDIHMDEIQMDTLKIHDNLNKEKNNTDINMNEQLNQKKLRDEQINYNITHEQDNRASHSIEVNDESTDNDLIVVEKFEVPSNLKKTFIFSMVLFVVGLTLFILGFISQVATADPGKGITFWVLGGIVMIPGGYYSYQFYKARRTLNLEERDEILDQIPEL